MATIDNYGGPLSIEVGLDNKVNYFVSTNKALQRKGFQVVSSFGRLMNEISVAVKGQVQAIVNIEFQGGLGDAYLRIQISDINSKSQKCECY